MNGSDFAQRLGYQEAPLDFKAPDYLPEGIRRRAGMMFVGHFVGNYELQPRFVQLVLNALPASPAMWEWFDNIPGPDFNPLLPPGAYSYSEMSEHLVRPLTSCDWRLFYTVVENVWAEWRLSTSTIEDDFSPEFNFLLRSHGIPWMLHGGLVIPSADSEFAEELKYAREVTHPPTADQVNDPHELIRDALAALYRKQGGPDLSAACVHAWGAWKAAAGAASGFGARDGRTFEFVGDEYPALGSTMKEWQKLAEGGRHPETGAPLTESETRFIVMLCVNAVRFLCPTCRGDDTA